MLGEVRAFWRSSCFYSLNFFARLIFGDLLFNIFIFEISEKDLLKLCQKLEKLSKNCSVKIELRIASYSKRLIIQNPSPKYKLWFKYSAIVKKKSLSTVIMQNIEKVLILFWRIIHTDFRSSPLEPSTLKILYWISFLIKIAYIRTVSLHYTSRYVSVG